MTGEENGIKSRLDFIGLDEASLKSLAAVEHLVERHLTPALDQFYDRIETVPKIKQFFSGKEQMNRAQGRQTEHWSAIAKGKMDEDYFKSSTAVGLRHARIGLEPRWYIGGYGLIVENLVKGVMADFVRETCEASGAKGGFMSKGDKVPVSAVMDCVDVLSNSVTTLVKAAMVDIDIAVSTYMDKIMEEQAARDKEAADEVRHVVQTTGSVLERIANGDLEARVTEEFKGEFAQIGTATNDVAERLKEIMGTLRGTSGTLKSATSEILSGANDLSERTTRQAATIEETSARMEELAGTVQDNASKAREASGTARTVAESAHDGAEVMSKATNAMERITTSSSKISNIIGMIDDIAFQTNLLALNASVEAARAGEAGKGFAVVAIEVRRLAQSAADASSDVKSLIEQSAEEVSTGASFVTEASEKLNHMLQAVQKSRELVEAISEASGEQANAIGDITSAVRQMDEMTQHNAALVEETNAAIEQTDNQVNELDRIVGYFTFADSKKPASMTAPKKASAPTRKAEPAKSGAAAAKYLSHGNAAVDAGEWSEF